MAYTYEYMLGLITNQKNEIINHNKIHCLAKHYPKEQLKLKRLTFLSVR